MSSYAAWPPAGVQGIYFSDSGVVSASSGSYVVAASLDLTKIPSDLAVVSFGFEAASGGVAAPYVLPLIRLSIGATDYFWNYAASSNDNEYRVEGATLVVPTSGTIELKFRPQDSATQVNIKRRFMVAIPFTPIQ